MKKLLSVVLVFVMLFCTGLTAIAETAIVVTQKSPLTMRSQPEQSGKEICKIPKGETVTVIEKGSWPKVEYNGNQGYVNGKYLEYHEDNTQESQPLSSQSSGVVYTATESGFGGDVTVSMTIDNGNITNISVQGEHETKGVGDQAIAELPHRILEAQSADIDGISGATLTSRAILNAAKHCIEQASVSTDAVADADIDNIAGIWEEESMGSAFKLTLDEDGTAQLNVGQSLYKMNWTFDGKTLTLTQKGIPIYGAYDGETIILDLKNDIEYKLKPVSLLNKKSDDKPSNATEKVDNIVGTWIDEYMGSAFKLTLDEDGTAQLNVGESLYKMNWSFDGKTLTLTQKGIPIYGTYDGETIILDLKNGVEYKLKPVSLRNKKDSGEQANVEKVDNIVGTWVAENLSEYNLILHEDGTAQVTVKEKVYELDWTFDGKTLTLMPNPSGIPVYGVYDGETITLNLFNEEHKFKPDFVRDESFAPGSIVKFGHYPQTESGEDQTPIEWCVLERQGNRALIVSRYGLDEIEYHKEDTSITWEKCSLRAWLNDEFFNRAFTQEEANAILYTNVDNGKDQLCGDWNTTGGNDTLDRVFLLSGAEANRYFGATEQDGDNMKARVAPTAYAISQGADASDDDYVTAEGEPTWGWWLRSPGFQQNAVEAVWRNGTVLNAYVYYKQCCVRPALWVNLESGLF